MGFLCIDRSLKKDVEQSDLKNQKLVRDIGLDNVYNLNPEINFCSEIFINPSFYMSGTSKLFTGSTTNLTGCTSGTTEIYNLDYTSDFNIYFNITGDTSFTAYTGSFCYKIFTDNNFGSVSSGILNNGSELFNYCISFSSITSTTITKQFLDSDLVDNWGQYLIRPYYTFYSKNCSNKTYNTWDYITQTNGFNNNTDYLFTTVINPPKPNLQPPSEPEKANYTLVTDSLYYDGISGQRGSQAINNTLNYFLLTAIPSNGQILLILNGIQLTQNYDFRLLIQGFGQPPIVEILNNEIKPTDWLFATYIAGQPPSWVNNLGIYFIDTVVVDSITNVTTPSYRTSGDNTINYNTTNNKYEFFTSLPIDSSYSTIVSVNGVKLAENYQYFLSDTFDGRIIFDLSNTEFKIGDIISVLAVSKSKGQDNNNYGSLKETQFNVIWSVPPSFTNNNVTGRFIIRAYDNDTNVLTNQSYIDFIDGQSNYNYLINNLSLNVNYRFEVIFEATYNSLLNNKIMTCSSSEGFFDTTSLYLNNKY